MYYARILDHSLLPTVTYLACFQASPTLATMVAMKRLLGYCVKRPNATQVIRPSPMLLKILFDASYLNRPNSGPTDDWRPTYPLWRRPRHPQASMPNPLAYRWSWLQRVRLNSLLLSAMAKLAGHDERTNSRKRFSSADTVTVPSFDLPRLYQPWSHLWALARVCWCIASYCTNWIGLHTCLYCPAYSTIVSCTQVQ